MNITLRDYIDIHHLPSVMAAKQQLMQLKKKGHLFISENLSSLGEDEPFQLYWHLMAHDTSLRNAFPIPRYRYNGYPKRAQTKEQMMTFFTDYFIDSSLESVHWSEFDWEAPYIGEEYVWIIRKNTPASLSV